VAARAVAAGGKLALAAKRPGTGVSPFEFWRLQGQVAARDYGEDEAIDG